MKKAQTQSFNVERFKKELITFPGYASLVLGWLGVAAAAAVAAASVFITQQPETTITTVSPVVTNSPSPATSILATLLGLAIMVLLVGAVWVYIAHWTKAGVVWLAKLFKVSDKNYWSFCTIVLMVGWLITCAIVFATSGDQYLDIVAFLAAVAIIVGSVSFGAAALFTKQKSTDVAQKPVEKTKKKLKKT